MSRPSIIARGGSLRRGAARQGEGQLSSREWDIYIYIYIYIRSAENDIDLCGTACIQQNWVRNVTGEFSPSGNVSTCFRNRHSNSIMIARHVASRWKRKREREIKRASHLYELLTFPNFTARKGRFLTLVFSRATWSRAIVAKWRFVAASYVVNRGERTWKKKRLQARRSIVIAPRRKYICRRGV